MNEGIGFQKVGFWETVKFVIPQSVWVAPFLLPPPHQKSFSSLAGSLTSEALLILSSLAVLLNRSPHPLLPLLQTPGRSE